ncbi:MAG: class II fructose-bisphosphatase [Egibacteraceae bacterium]
MTSRAPVRLAASPRSAGVDDGTASTRPRDAVRASVDMNALALHLLCGTQRAALACTPFVGCGDSDAADGAATAAMRAAFSHVPGTGTVVIGEGEKDDAPMLYNGEQVGDGGAPDFDLAVDPLENTTACARDADGAITVVAAAPSGHLWGSSAAWYMDKLIVGRRARGVIDITRPLRENLERVARALDKPVRELHAVVLDKPRHGELVRSLYDFGVHVTLMPDGDVVGALHALLPDPDADLLLGIGGAPEGVITACAVRLLGGDMQAALEPQSDEERRRIREAGFQPGAPLTLDELVRSEECCFVATSVTPGRLLHGPEPTGEGWRTRTFLSTPLHPCLIVEAVHRHDEASTEPWEGDRA